MNKNIIQIILLGYLIFPFSCKKVHSTTGCGDLSGYDDFSKINSISLPVGKIVEDRDYEFFSDSFSYNYQDAAIAITADDVETYSYGGIKNLEFDFSIVPEVFACSPVPPEPVQKVTEISITSNDTINNIKKYKPGEELSGLFYVNSSPRKSDKESVGSFITNQTDYISFGNPATQMIFTLRHKVLFRNQNLTFHIKFDDGRDFKLTTNQFLIKE